MLCATGKERSSICRLVGLVLGGFLLSSSELAAQSTYTAQLTGVVSDSSGGVIPSTKIMLTDEVTNVATLTVTNAEGIYVLTGIRPATYSIRAEAANFGIQERKNVVLAVSQQATIDFNLDPSSVAVRVTVTGEPPLLDTGNASLGTDITNEYVRDRKSVV